jgi:alpha-tubulin suppressor-like RCC1 family protein
MFKYLVVVVVGFGIGFVSYTAYPYISREAPALYKTVRSWKIFQGNLPKFEKVAAGTFFSLALADDGNLWVAGANREGQLGVGIRDDVKGWVNCFSGVKDISVGNTHSMVLTNDGRLWVAGSNHYGELGLGYKVKGALNWRNVLSNVVAIAAGQRHSLAVTKDGRLWVAGDNNKEQLGLRRYIEKVYYVRAPDGTKKKKIKKIWQTKIRRWRSVLNNVKAVYAGVNHSLVLKKDDSLWVAGSNSYGQYGLGEIMGGSKWVKVMDNVKKLSKGFSDSSIVIRKTTKELEEDAVAREKYRDYLRKRAKEEAKIKAEILRGDLEEDETTVNIRAPIYIPQGGGELLVTGWNWNGQIGVLAPEEEVEEDAGEFSDFEEERERNHQYYWAEVLTDVMGVSSAPNNCFAITNDGTLWASGSNSRGQLGCGGENNSWEWVQVFSNVRDVSAGYFHSLLVTKDGELWVAGDNFHGQLGTKRRFDEEIWIKIKKFEKKRPAKFRYLENMYDENDMPGDVKEEEELGG